jgi:ornithine cyclodeaminase
MRDAIEADKLAFRLLSAGKIDSPLRTMIRGKYDGSFLCMPAYAADMEAAAVKLVNVFPHNPRQGLMTTPAQILLLDGKTGYACALLDGTYVTQIRTGAASGAAFDLLAKKNCKKGALIGTGGQAAAQLEAMLEAGHPETVSVFSRNAERCAEFCRKMQAELSSYGAEITPADTADACIEDADLIITVTSSSEPVFDGKKVKPGATVSCVGTYEQDKHELDPALLVRASKIICDCKDAVLAESGDLLLPIADGLITADDIQGSLGDVINGTISGRENEDEIIVFETVGVAAQDLVTAKAIYDKAVERSVGMVW